MAKAPLRDRLQLATRILRSGWTGAAAARQGRPYSTWGGLTGGGVYNPTTGMGGALDKSEASVFTPTHWYSGTPIQVLCVESFAARKAVNIIPRDMFLQRRRFKDAGDEVIEAFEKACRTVHLDERIRDAMIAGRQYGSAIMVLMSKEAPLEEPLDPKRIREGDLTAIRVFHRFDITAHDRDRDPTSPNFNRPTWYDIHPATGGVPFRVHHSRIVRFDGMKDPGDSGYTVYDQAWGVSILVPIVTTVLQEAGIAQATAHLVQEASVPVLLVANLRETIARPAHEVTAEQIGEAVNRLKSIFRLLMLDKSTEEFTRVAVQFGGLAEVLDHSEQRVAAAAEIPMTRFWSTSPKGMNATGEHDMENYIITFEATRANELPSVYDMVDEVVARSGGVRTVPRYEWPSLLDLSEADQAKIALDKATAAKTALDSGFIDEDEGRAVLDGDAVFGALEGEAPGPPDYMYPDPNEGGTGNAGGQTGNGNGGNANGGDK